MTFIEYSGIAIRGFVGFLGGLCLGWAYGIYKAFDPKGTYFLPRSGWQYNDQTQEYYGADAEAPVISFLLAPFRWLESLFTTPFQWAKQLSLWPYQSLEKQPGISSNEINAGLAQTPSLPVASLKSNEPKQEEKKTLPEVVSQIPNLISHCMTIFNGGAIHNGKNALELEFKDDQAADEYVGLMKDNASFLRVERKFNFINGYTDRNKVYILESQDLVEQIHKSNALNKKIKEVQNLMGDNVTIAPFYSTRGSLWKLSLKFSTHEAANDYHERHGRNAGNNNLCIRTYMENTSGSVIEARLAPGIIIKHDANSNKDLHTLLDTIKTDCLQNQKAQEPAQSSAAYQLGHRGMI